ncbi:hypothetical protein ABZ249_26400 [Nocardiopsis sp. NPDC006139]
MRVVLLGYAEAEPTEENTTKVYARHCTDPATITDLRFRDV